MHGEHARADGAQAARARRTFALLHQLDIERRARLQLGVVVVGVVVKQARVKVDRAAALVAGSRSATTSCNPSRMSWQPVDRARAQERGGAPKAVLHDLLRVLDDLGNVL